MRLTGQRGLVVGVANKWSLAWGIAQRSAAEGAELALTYQNERLGKHVREGIDSVRLRGTIGDESLWSWSVHRSR